MKKISMVFVALLLCFTMAALSPAQVIAATSDSAKHQYISEVKVGMGATSEEAAAELLAEGFTILKEDGGSYADLNYEAGTKSGMKKGPTQKVVYLGYKTTDDPKKAITDLAVMNMNGGYSVEDYNILMNNYLEGQIKPFVNRFIATLNEYRENYQKPKDSLNHIRADYYRQMLNKLTDDDTGNKPLGDLLLNETKYEMGDEKYNALSEAEKKNHADILTLLTQGNGQAVMLMEGLVAKAADTADNSWMERISDFDLDVLKAKVKKDNPNLSTEADINAELDKQYYDIAMKLVGKQTALSESLNNEEKNTEVENKLKNKEDQSGKVKEKVEKLGDDISEKEAEDLAVDMLDAEADMVSGSEVLENIVMAQYLDAAEYGDESLLDFFSNNAGYSEDIVRGWYPIAASLSEGQIAALDFLSLEDLISVAVTSKDGYQETGLDKLSTASIYQDVDRAIYEPGGVALTNAALRANKKASEDPDNTSFSLSNLGVILWACTGAGATAMGASLIAAKVIGSMKPPADLVNRVNELTEKIINAKSVMECTYTDSFYLQHPYYVDTIQWTAKNNIIRNTEELRPLQEQLDAANAQIAAKSTLCKYLSAGFAIVTAILAGLAIYTTVSEMLEYYKVTFTPIPRYIVDEANITEKSANGEKVVIKSDSAYYKVVPCNRKEGSSDIEKENYRILGTANDLNGDVGKQWLSLYSVRYEKGKPILADSLKVVKGSDELPSGYEAGIHRFGEPAKFNLTSTLYCYNDKPNGTYVFFKNADKTVKEMTGGSNKVSSGSMFSFGSLAIGGGIGLLLGGGLAALVMTAARKRKEKNAG